MAAPDIGWNDPRTIVAVGGLAVGIIGLTYGIIKDRWSRRESRLDVVAKILEPMVCCTQCLFLANNNRRKIEQLKHSFPGTEKPAEVVHHLNTMHDDYAQQIKQSSVEYRDAEAAFASHSFRLPDSITKSMKVLQTTLSEYGRVVNQGLFDKADVQLAQFRDDYKRISDTARGWRLADPFEGIRKRFRKPEPEDAERRSEFDLTQEEMHGVLELVYKRTTTQAHNAFAVHPPKKIIDDPEILKSDEIIDELKDSVFTVVFQDATAKMLSLPELIALQYNLIVAHQQMIEAEAIDKAIQAQGDREYQFKFRICMQELMQPETVKVLLSKIAFSDVPSDG